MTFEGSEQFSLNDTVEEFEETLKNLSPVTCFTTGLFSFRVESGSFFKQLYRKWNFSLIPTACVPKSENFQITKPFSNNTIAKYISQLELSAQSFRTGVPRHPGMTS